ncbi:hypothetical protein LCGC14_2167870 [marine sediment metagenome]|uniref:Uncharacterized protein n=1 Tax=marine sediment metagenome TaxID=412755 RepID=A0A0F9ED33_9ZZZZ
MNVYEFFDPYEHSHLEAFQTLQDTGSWPKGFLPKDTVIPNHWQMMITAKIADAWMEENL